MTKVKILKNKGHIVDVECDGHTGYGVQGEDIVCASLSSIVQTAALGLLYEAQVQIDMQRDEARGYIHIRIPSGLQSTTQIKVDAILNTMLYGIADLYEGFSDFIELEVK